MVGCNCALFLSRLHQEIDDQSRDPRMIDRDHLVGQVLIKDNNQDVEERNAKLEGNQHVRNQLRRRLSHRGVQLELHPAGGALRQLLLKGQRKVFRNNLPKNIQSLGGVRRNTKGAFQVNGSSLKLLLQRCKYLRCLLLQQTNLRLTKQ